ncbi:hypothetical protein MRX96_009306 [Rhipicephalus microplus]
MFSLFLSENQHALKAVADVLGAILFCLHGKNAMTKPNAVTSCQGDPDLKERQVIGHKDGCCNNAEKQFNAFVYCGERQKQSRNALHYTSSVHLCESPPSINSLEQEAGRGGVEKAWSVKIDDGVQKNI